MSDAKRMLGKHGENLAVAYLVQRGYRVLARNFRTHFGEIDIIAEMGELLVFVEVKSRSSLAFGEGYEAVNATKRRKLQRAALCYLQLYHLQQRPLRFDVISLLMKKSGELQDLRHFEAAF